MDPYAPPRASSVASPTDDVDLYLETLPPPLLKAAMGTLGILAFMMLLLAVRLMLAVVATPAAMALEAGHVVLGVACLVVAWGVRRGHVSLLFVGFAICPLAAIASVFALLTGSIGGLFAGALALASFALLALSYGAVGRIGRAHKAMRGSIG
jgi:hypothetical protein